jgi:hypothetical protein
MRVLYGSNTGLASIVPGGGELGGHLNRVVAVPAVDQGEAADASKGSRRSRDAGISAPVTG